MTQLSYLQSRFPASKWPTDILQLCENWTNNDHKWRSNVIWFSFLQNYRKKDSKNFSPTVSTFKVPIPGSFQADSLLDFLKIHLECKDDHFVTAIITKFNESFSLQTFSGHDLKHLITELKYFVNLALKTILIYYGGVVKDLMKTKNGEISDIILSYAISDRIHEQALAIYAEIYKEKEAKYIENLENFQHLRCKDFGITKLFQLDE